jgi:hypothetical protein
MNYLPGLLTDGAQRKERPYGGDAGFLLEFPASSGQQVLSRFRYALGNGPCAGITCPPEGASGMGQKDLEP